MTVLILRVKELRLFYTKVFPLLESKMKAVGTTFNVVNYDVVWAVGS